jgi:hypothetical protein
MGSRDGTAVNSPAFILRRGATAWSPGARRYAIVGFVDLRSYLSQRLRIIKVMLELG